MAVAERATAHRRRAPWVAMLAVALALVTSGLSPTNAQTIRYTYDEAGRLTSVTNTANETAEYVYDAAGNITQIRRTAANVPAVTEFTPNSGPVGTAVTIVGANFGATPAANTVRFNATVASVSSASTTQLVASVPAGATSGPISVQTAAGTGTSAQSFTVTAAGGLPAPTITTFAPAVAEPATVITLSGTNFDTGTGMTKVYLNELLAPVTNVTATSITFAVPYGAGSGRLRVVTRSGSATSSGDLVVGTAGSGSMWPVTEFAGVHRLTLNGASASVNVTATAGAARWVVFLFDGGPNAHASVDLPTYAPVPSGAYFNWEVRNLRNEIVTSPDLEQDRDGNSIRPNNRTIHIPPMLLSGTYALFVKIGTSSTFNASAKLRSDPILLIDGASATAFSWSATANPTTQFPGQSLRYFFNGYQTQRLGLGVSSLVTGPNGTIAVPIQIRRQDWLKLIGGDFLGGQYCAPPGCGANLPSVPETGVYSLILEPDFYQTTSSSASLWLSQDLVATPTVGTTYPLSLPTPGRNARLQIAGTANQSLDLRFSEVTFATASTPAIPQGLTVTVLSPSGSLFSGPHNVGGGSSSATTIPLPTFTTSGTYTVFVDPGAGTAGTANVIVSQSATGTLAIDGSSTAVTLTAAGQTGRYTFTNSVAGRNLGLGVSAVTVTPGSAGAPTVRVRDAGNNEIMSKSCPPSNPGSGCQLNLLNLATGTYTVWVEQSPTATGLSATLTLSTDVPPAALTPGVPATVTVARRGQDGRVTFSGTQGQNWHITIANTSTAPFTGASIAYHLLAPNGQDYGPNGAGTSTDWNNLPATGTYTLWFDQDTGLTFSLTVTVTPY